MSWFSINRNPSRRQLLVFALSWLVMFSVAGWLVRSLGAVSWVVALLWAVGAAVPLAGLWRPGLLRTCYLGMALVTWPLATAVSLLLLGIVYYGVITPIGLMLRLFGYDPLRRRNEGDGSSSWIDRQEPSDLKRYFRQY